MRDDAFLDPNLFTVGMMSMEPNVIRSRSFNVLVALADADLDVAPIVPALQPHLALVCASATQALDAVRQFKPDIALIDLRIPDAATFGSQLMKTAGGRNITFVAMTAAMQTPASAIVGFRYSLAMPATSAELEQLLWQIGRDEATSTSHPQPPNRGMIG
jgi:CheY-like chemotaxis protein